MHKKVNWFILVMLLMTMTICACSSNTICTNDTYALIEKNGKCYIQLDKEYLQNLQQEAYGYCLLEAQYPSFMTVSEMRQMLLMGSIEEAELATLAGQSEDGTFQICDPNRLYEAVAPSGVSIGKVTLYNQRYTFSLTAQNAGTGYLECIFNDEAYDWEITSIYDDFLQDHQYILTDRTLADRNARELVVDNGSGIEMKYLLYTLDTPDGTVRVKESYVLRHPYSSDVSENVPQSIDIMGTDAKFHVWMTGLAERPTVEWMSQFGLQEAPVLESIN